MTDPLALAHDVATACGEILMQSFGSIVARSKAGGVSHDLVTDADLASERRAVELIRAAQPDAAILGEENATGAPPKHPERERSLWIIDPLDGTTNYAHGLPHFAVSVAYYERGEPVAGVVWNPARGDRYAAARGQGATFSGQGATFSGQGATPGGEPLRVGGQSALDEVIVGCGFYYDRGPMMQATLAAIEELFGRGIHGIRRMGTASLDLCQVAGGGYGAFFEYQLQPWDYAAGRLILEEAGGRVTTTGGDPLPVRTTSLLATNGLLHDPMLAITKRHEIG